MNDIEKIINLLTPLIVALGVAYINYRSKKRDYEQSELLKKRDYGQSELLKKRDEEQMKQLDTRNKIVIDRIDSLELVVNSVESKLDVHIHDDDFRQHYRNSIKNTVISVLEASHTLKQAYKNMLMYYTDSVEKLGLNFYYSERRAESKRAVEKYLQQEKNILIDDFCKYVDSNDDFVRIFNNKKILFSDFLCKNNMFSGLELLIMTLIKNGLNEKDVIDLFTTHIDKFIELFITASITWESLENSKKEVA